MENYYFLFKLLANLNSLLLLIYCIVGFKALKKTSTSSIKIVVFYLMFSCLFDSLSRFFQWAYENELLENSFISLKILYRLGELLIIGYLINKFWLQSKPVWGLIGISSLYLLYELFTYREKGILNYVAYAQISANILLLLMVVFNLIKQLQSATKFSVTNQMFCMVFLTYFSIHLIYAVISNFIINQSFSNQSFALFYCSYAVLHIVYYFALALIVYKKSKPLFTQNF